ncbi:hypothetical protein FB451DRAFT_1387877 [Mycena latifolia]|nr:hypothetical protein FB451DRAFT_1387877 [Mycena latifolia]
MAKTARVRKRRAYKPVANEERRNLKLWAQGAWETVVKAHIPGYTDALERGWRAERDYLLDVCNEYHARISWCLADHEEPTLPLPDYDGFAVPTKEILSEEETAAKRERIETLNARIARWLKYRARRLHRGGSQHGPATRSAFQQFMHESYESEIAPVVEARFAMERNNVDRMGLTSTQRGPNAPFRSRIARELFAALPEDEQIALKERAVHEAKEAREAYDKAMKSPPLKTLEERQKCIDNLGSFITPILCGIQEYTGLYSVIVLGGPIPCFAGALKTISCVYDFSSNNWANARFNRDVVGLMHEYLESAFTPVECTEAALPDATDILDQAKYAFNKNRTGSGSDNDNDSSSGESGSESNSNSLDSGEGSDSGSESGSESESGEGTRKGKKKRGATEKEKENRKKEKKKKRAQEKEKESVAAMGDGKKRKRLGAGDGGAAAKKAKTTGPITDADGLTYDQRRNQNIARNKATLAAIDDSMRARGVAGGKPLQAPKTRPPTNARFPL